MGMRLNIPLMLLLAIATLPLLAAAPRLHINDEAHLPQAKMLKMQRDYPLWAERVFRYNHFESSEPVKLVISRSVHVGFYVDDTLYLPPDDEGEMLETFIHELAHHATGHDSSFFLKEGIASNTLEAVFLAQGQMPQGWPQYGQSNDAWVSLYLKRGQLPPLKKFMDMDSFDGSSQDESFRSWQAYVVGASFVGWIIKHEGYAAFRKVFDSEQLGPEGAAWERRWQADIRAENWPEFDVADALPRGERYQNYVRRLRAE